MLDCLKSMILPDCIIDNMVYCDSFFTMPKGGILCVGDSGGMVKYVLQGEQHWCVGVCYSWSLVLWSLVS